MDIQSLAKMDAIYINIRSADAEVASLQEALEAAKAKAAEAHKPMEPYIERAKELNISKTKLLNTLSDRYESAARLIGDLPLDEATKPKRRGPGRPAGSGKKKAAANEASAETAQAKPEAANAEKAEATAEPVANEESQAASPAPSEAPEKAGEAAEAPTTAEAAEPQAEETASEKEPAAEEAENVTAASQNPDDFRDEEPVMQQGPTPTPQMATSVPSFLKG